MPASAKTRGKSPHAIPSLRLFTSPAWLTDERSRVGEAGAGEDLALREQGLCVRSPRSGFVLDVVSGLPDGQHRQGGPEHDESHAQVEWLGPQTDLRRNPPGREGRQGHGEVPRALVQAHGQSAVAGPRQVDLHDHGGRPRETLAHTEEDIGDQDPPPLGRPHQQERDGRRHDPSDHQYQLPPRWSDKRPAR